tara:strand:+ start:159 stop:971 length:813 start_codon:yes stop_codon:yes gene_type:complete
MIIRTSQQQNLADCCGCEIPECEPLVEYESCYGTLTVSAFSGHFTNLAGTRYKVETTTHGNCTYVETETLNSYYYGPLPDGTTSSDSPSTVTTGSLTGWDFTIVTTPSDPITWSSWITGAKSLINSNFAGVVDADYTGSYTYSSLSHPPSYVAPDTSFSVSIIFARYRFSPPTGYARTVWEMEWDEVAASDDWWSWYDGGMVGTEPTPGPSLVAHQTWTWDGVSDWSAWYELPPPTSVGKTRVVNIMTICYHSTRIGVKPTSYGDEVALP